MAVTASDLKALYPNQLGSIADARIELFIVRAQALYDICAIGSTLWDRVIELRTMHDLVLADTAGGAVRSISQTSRSNDTTQSATVSYSEGKGLDATTFGRELKEILAMALGTTIRVV